MHLAVRDAVNGMDGNSDGAAVLQYVGHGNFFVWSNDVFWDDRDWDDLDTTELNNGAALPWLLAHNCLTGGFHAAEKTIGQNWLQLNGGGAVGVFAPTGLSFNFVSRRVTEVIWEDLYGPRKERQVMVPVMNTLVRLCGQGSIEPCQQYVVLGDPAMRLGLHSVEPPGGLQASPGNAEIQLSWAGSATPGVTYNVYRSLDLFLGSYLKANTTPLTGTSFNDTTVSNALQYFYYVLAVDEWGFESRWSNFNSDCDSAGPDCVDATPLNPNPPTPPTGVTLTDPGDGASLMISWSPNPENDLESYTILLGTESGVYTTVIPTGKATSRTLVGLAEGQMYYAAVTAENTSGLTSGMSSEASDFPAFARGLRAPRYIDDLLLGKSGPDLTLQWTEVDTDVFGKPETVVRYEVLRGTEPAYSSAGMTKIGECFSPCSFPFVDPGGASGAGESFYRVRAVDDDGNAGGMGSEAPQGTVLTLSRSGPGLNDLSLNWTAVTMALDGTAAELSHYALYAADQPFTREEIRDGDRAGCFFPTPGPLLFGRRRGHSGQRQPVLIPTA